MPNKSTVYKRISIAFVAAHIVSFLVFYMPNYAIVLPDAAVEPYLIAREILRNILSFVIPAVSAATVLMLDGEESLYKKMLGALRLCAPSAVYYVPYSYLYCLSLGFDSVESVLFAIPMAATDIVIGVVLCILLSFVGLIFVRRGRAMGDELTVGSGVTDISNPVNRGFFAICIVRMALMLILEIVDTVTFLIEESGAYGTSEILYIMLTYVLILAYTLGTYAALVVLKNKTTPKEEN